MHYSDSVFTTHMINVELPTLTTPLYISPFGDIHFDSDNHDRDRWNDYCHHYKSREKDKILYIGMGDYNDFASWGERKALKNSRLHEQTLLKFDKLARKSEMQFARSISFMKDKLIGFISGNHEWVYADGMASSQCLSERFKTKYLGSLSYIKIAIKTARSNERTCLDLFVAHGKSSGKLVGTSFNRVDDMRGICPNADIYIMGHDHKKGGIEVVDLEFYPNKDKLKARQRQHWLCRSGSFLKGYVENSPSYIVRMLAKPVPLGTIELEINFNRLLKDKKATLVKTITCKT